MLVSDGVDTGLISAITDATDQQQVNVEFVAATVGGVTCSDGSSLAADQRLDGGPSVLYDAVVLAVSEDGVEPLRDAPAARDFVNDALAHCKFIGYSPAARALFDAVGFGEELDGGCQQLAAGSDVAGFLDACAALRYWPRQSTLP